jgi:DNA-binding CsgD family transcriptional regulator
MAPQRVTHRLPRLPAERATEREVAVVAAVIATGSEKAAAHRLGLSHSTVKHHLASARSKVGAATTAQLVWILAPRLPEPEGMGWRTNSGPLDPVVGYWRHTPAPAITQRSRPHWGHRHPGPARQVRGLGVATGPAGAGRARRALVVRPELGRQSDGRRAGQHCSGTPRALGIVAGRGETARMRARHRRCALSSRATQCQMDVLAAYVAAGGSVTDAAELLLDLRLA